MDFPASQVWASAECAAKVRATRSQIRDSDLDWNDIFSRVLSLRTFSNLWYWLAVCGTWMMASHWIIGVPFDMIYFARRRGGKAAQDLDTLVDINARRLISLNEMGGVVLVAVLAFLLSGLAVMAIYYKLELAQGILFLVGPLTVVGMINMWASKQLIENPLSGNVLAKRLMHLRLLIQFVAMTSIFFSVVYGMYFNLTKPFGY